MLDLMLDLETLAPTPDALILSIGAVLFDRDTPRELGPAFYERIHVNPAHGRITHETLDWWMERRGSWPMGACRPLDAALAAFTRFVEDNTPRCELGQPAPRLCIWGHGADFDPPILHSAYLRCGMTPPWGKGQVRDTRTLFDLAGFKWTTDGRATPRIHHALEDAKAAALAVQEAIKVLRDRT